MTRVLVVEPGYCPYQAAFDSPQAAISEVIEGDSLLLKPFGTSKIGVVCSKNQSLLKYNRQLEDGSTIRGRFLVCGLSESKMLGLSKEQAERYNRLLFFPQVEDNHKEVLTPDVRNRRLEELSARMRTVRRELNTCADIETDAAALQLKWQEVRQAEKEEREVNENEQRRRSR